jgi:predicted DNA-binding ribbon-helix-helix protein
MLLENLIRLPTFDLFTMPKHPTKHSIVFRGRKTSLSLEAPFWVALRIIANERKQTLSETLVFISEQWQTTNLSSAARVFVLDYFLNAMNVPNDKQTAAPQSHGK